MSKTLNQRIYETPGDIKKAIYDSGKQAILEQLKTGIETFLTDDDVDVIIAEGEVFVPIGALRKIIAGLEESNDKV